MRHVAGLWAGGLSTEAPASSPFVAAYWAVFSMFLVVTVGSMCVWAWQVGRGGCTGPRQTRFMLTMVLGITVLVVVGACAGCSSNQPVSAPGPATSTATTATAPRVTTAPVPTVEAVPTGRGGQPRGANAIPAADPYSADSVSAVFAMVTFTYDTAIDRSSFDAQVRSAAYATPAFAAQLRQPLANTGNAEWNELAAHHGFTTVALRANADDGRPPDGLNTAARSYTVTVTGAGDGGWSAQLSSHTMYLFLSRAAATAPWQVQRVSFGSAQ